jgi:hypothetical protein
MYFMIGFSPSAPTYYWFWAILSNMLLTAPLRPWPIALELMV